MNIDINKLLELIDLIEEKEILEVIKEDIYNKTLTLDNEEKEVITKMYSKYDKKIVEINNRLKNIRKKCNHLAIDFGYGFNKCLFCEQEEVLQGFNKNIDYLNVSEYTQKFGRIVSNIARKRSYETIKDMYIEILLNHQNDEEDTEIDKRDLMYEIAIKTKGYRKIKK